MIRIALETLAGGGLLVSLWTLRQTRKKMEEEIRAMQSTNADSILRTNEEYIVKPLKREINGLRKTVNRLTATMQKILACPHLPVCPLRDELQNLYPTDKPDHRDENRHGADRGGEA